MSHSKLLHMSAPQRKPLASWMPMTGRLVNVQPQNLESVVVGS